MVSIRSQRSQADQEGSRWSGGSLIPSNGYSSLFTSGLMRTHTPQTPPARPSHSGSTSPNLPHPIPFPQASPYIPSPSRRHGSPSKTRSPSKLRPSGSPAKRRAPPSPSKPNPSLAADRALTDVMTKLRLYAASPAKRASPIKQSRWSSSSEESGDGEGFWKPRKSGESNRSKVTMKSKKSTWSLRSRKSEDGERPEEERPPMPPLPGMKKEAKGQVPVTPGRGRRVVEGLARRLGLTPKKKNTPPTLSRQASLELPPIPADRIPRKSSLTTLRTLAKKTSTGTLRSVKSIYGHPTESPPDLPTCIPTTPRRMPKSSIGPPKNGRGGVSPSLFDAMPRKAPKTPDRSEDVDMVQVGTEKMDVDEVITFPSSTPKTDSLSPDISTPRAHEDFTNASEFLTSTPVSQRYNSSGGNTPILTVKAAQQSGKTPSKSRRLLGLLPTYQKLQSQPTSPNLPKPGSFGAPPRTSSRPGLHLGSSTRDPLGSLSHNTSPYKGADWDAPSIPLKSEIQRPATSQGHHRKPTLAQDDYFNYPSQSQARPKTHYRSRRVPDFSRPMSKQDLSMSISSSAHLEADMSWSANIDTASTETPSQPASQTNAKQSPGHERLNSNSSLITTESTESFGTAHTAQTALSGVSGVSGVSGQSSGVGEWELERYLRELESEDESLQPGRDEEVLSGVSERKGGRGAVIQQARYGIRI